MTQVDFHDGEYLLERKPLQVEERPPMILEPRYMQRLEAEA
jgi:hypothetical protein